MIIIQDNDPRVSLQAQPVPFGGLKLQPPITVQSPDHDCRLSLSPSGD